MSPTQGARSAGDFTGKQKDTQNKEARLADQQRSADMAMANADQAVEQREGVWDPQSQERVDGAYGGPDAEAEQVQFAEPQQFPENGGTPPPFFSVPPAERAFTGKETEDEIAEYIASRPAAVPQIPILRSPRVKLRVNQDVEKMTYGMTPSGEPNNYDFREGFTYDVDREIAEHLNQRGLVAQIVG